MGSEKMRTAGVRQPERLSAGLSTAEIAKAAKSEIASTFRVMTQIPIPVFRGTSDACHEFWERKYEGRVHSYDWEVRGSDSDCVLYLTLWTTVAEWKSLEIAERHAEGLRAVSTAPIEVVARNGRREHVLKHYGTLKLPDPQ